jgi:hypothetical protein
MKKSIIIFSFLISISHCLFGLENSFTSDLADKNNISITVSCNDLPLDSVKVVILDNGVILGSGWTNNEGLANILIADVSGLTVNIKAVKKGYDSFYLKGGLLSSSTSFQINMHLKTNKPKPTSFLEFQLEKEDIKQPI